MGKCQDLAKWETFASHRPKAAPGGAGTVLGKMWAIGESPREQEPPVKQPLEAGKLEKKTARALAVSSYAGVSAAMSLILVTSRMSSG